MRSATGRPGESSRPACSTVDLLSVVFTALGPDSRALPMTNQFDLIREKTSSLASETASSFVSENVTCRALTFTLLPECSPGRSVTTQPLRIPKIRANHRKATGTTAGEAKTRIATDIRPV